MDRLRAAVHERKESWIPTGYISVLKLEAKFTMKKLLATKGITMIKMRKKLLKIQRQHSRLSELRFLRWYFWKLSRSNCWLVIIFSAVLEWEELVGERTGVEKEALANLKILVKRVGVPGVLCGLLCFLLHRCPQFIIQNERDRENTLPLPLRQWLLDASLFALERWSPQESSLWYRQSLSQRALPQMARYSKHRASNRQAYPWFQEPRRVPMGEATPLTSADLSKPFPHFFSASEVHPSARRHPAYQGFSTPQILDGRADFWEI